MSDCIWWKVSSNVSAGKNSVRCSVTAAFEHCNILLWKRGAAWRKNVTALAKASLVVCGTSKFSCCASVHDFKLAPN